MISDNPFQLNNKRILITGASSGIGRQCAISCSKMGAIVVGIGRNEQGLKDTYRELIGDNHEIIVADLTDYPTVTDKLEISIKSNGSFDGLIHCAGIEKTMLLRNLKPEEFIEVFNTNFVSGINILKQLTKKKNFNPGFKCVFISSITAVISRVGTLAYTASKGAIVSATRELAEELAPKGINVNCISPGTVLTPMMEKVLSEMTDEEKSNRLSGFPLGIGKPDDIANGCIFLLSEAARWITGQNLIIDGGYTIR